MADLERRKGIDGLEVDSMSYVPGRTIEEKIEWKKQRKAECSRPCTIWTPDELRTTFPKGSWQDDFMGPDYYRAARRLFPKREQGQVFVANFPVQFGCMRRIFDQTGHEVERDEYQKFYPEGRNHAFATHLRTLSEYDDDGYLVKFLRLGVGGGDFFRTFEYAVRPDGIKEVTKCVTQSVLREPGIMEVEKLSGRRPRVIDFTDTPLVLP